MNRISFLNRGYAFKGLLAVLPGLAYVLHRNSDYINKKTSEFPKGNVVDIWSRNKSNCVYKNTASRTYLVFQGRPRSKQSILTNAQVNLRRLSDDIRYWPAIFDYHPANLSR